MSKAVVMGELVVALVLLIASVTGIDRPVDATLQVDAERRVVEIQQDFSHTGLLFTEILAWNSGSDDPVALAVKQWRESPVHWAIMSDPLNTRIGCAVAQSGVNVSWFACSFDKKALLVAVVLPSLIVIPPPILLPNTETLPNTAMEGGKYVKLLRVR